MFWFDFNWQIQHLLNQFWWQINFLLLAGLVIVGYLSYKKPVYGVMATIILLPTYLFRSNIWFLPFTFLEICIWTTFITWIFNFLRQGQILPYFRYYYRTPILFIIITSTIAVYISPNLTAAAGLWKAYFIEPIMFFVVLTSVVQTEKNREKILWALGISTLVISLLAIYQKFTAFGISESSWVNPENRRVTSIFTSPNAVGLYLGPILALYSGWIISEFKNYKKTILKSIIVILGMLAISFTVSHGTLLGLLAAASFIVYLSCFKKSRCYAKQALIATAIIVITIITITPALSEKIVPVATFKDHAGQNRILLMQMSLDHINSNIKNFVFGAGILGFSEIQENQRDPLKMESLLYPHNIVFNFWLEIGIAGLLAFYFVVKKFFKKGFRLLQNRDRNFWINIGVMAAMIAVLVHGLVDVPYFKNDLAVLFWVIIALLI